MPLRNNKINASILLIVFALNTIVSFACSVGLVDFKKDHHGQETASSHSQDKGHAHQSGVGHKEPDEQTHQQHNHNEDEKSCCSDDVIKLAEADKTLTKVSPVPQPISVEVLATFYTFISGNHFAADALIKSAPPFVRSWHPTTISDLRIVIQSFQI